MSLVLYNTQTREKEVFKPVSPGHAGIYFCGPTVYSDPHLGHARGPIVFDTLKRWLQFSGYKVRMVSNITDVGHLTDDMDAGEDKMLKRAKLEKLEPMEIAEKYFWAYFDAMAKLGVRRPDIVPRASGHIIEQIEMTEELIKNGLAYERNGSVYFDISAWDSYGELSGRNTDELKEGTRIDINSDKDDPRDFALWKRAEPEHIMRWNSPWGEGFPGWHLECSVMSTKYLGDEFDIHGGGLDLIFPHHECELAQARGAGKGFAHYWMHWNMITLKGEKMAKSKNHFVTLEELFEEYDPLVIRFHLLRSHYRSLSDFSDDGILSSQQGLKRLKETYNNLLKLSDDSASDKDAFAKYQKSFKAAMDDDLNTPQAVAVLFDANKEINSKLKNASQAYINAAKEFFDDYFVEIFGLLGEAKEQSEINLDTVSGIMDLVMESRQSARARRDFKRSDEIRDKLASLGIILEDAADGSNWKLK